MIPKYKFEMENITLRLVILSSHRYLKYLSDQTL